MNKTQIFIICWTAVATIYIIYAAIFLPTDETVSATLNTAAKRWPILPLAVGLLLGHLFW